MTMKKMSKLVIDSLSDSVEPKLKELKLYVGESDTDSHNLNLVKAYVGNLSDQNFNLIAYDSQNPASALSSTRTLMNTKGYDQVELVPVSADYGRCVISNKNPYFEVAVYVKDTVEYSYGTYRSEISPCFLLKFSKLDKNLRNQMLEKLFSMLDKHAILGFNSPDGNLHHYEFEIITHFDTDIVKLEVLNLNWGHSILLQNLKGGERIGRLLNKSDYFRFRNLATLNKWVESFNNMNEVEQSLYVEDSDDKISSDRLTFDIAGIEIFNYTGMGEKMTGQINKQCEEVVSKLDKKLQLYLLKDQN